MKTARFKDVVSGRGRPQLHLTWSAPASDRELQTASKQHRVLTVHQETRGSKKDYGVVGLEVAPHAQYLVFPKSLQKFADRRIVGIQYDLLEKDFSSGGKLPAPRARPKRSSKNEADKVVPFEAPVAHSAPRPPKESASRVPVAPLPIPEPEETDPVKREIRRAISELKAGHPLKARKRLEGLLQP